MEYDRIDVESEDGEESVNFVTGNSNGYLQYNNNSNSGNNNNDNNNKAEKRAHHNALERKRRDHIKDSFKSLRHVLPSLRGERTASRALILTKAIEYTTFMRRKIVKDRQDIEELKQQNSVLEGQIRTLQEAHATGDYTQEIFDMCEAIDSDDLESEEEESENSEEETSFDSNSSESETEEI